MPSSEPRNTIAGAVSAAGMLLTASAGVGTESTAGAMGAAQAGRAASLVDLVRDRSEKKKVLSVPRSPEPPPCGTAVEGPDSRLRRAVSEAFGGRFAAPEVLAAPVSVAPDADTAATAVTLAVPTAAVASTVVATVPEATASSLPPLLLVLALLLLLLPSLAPPPMPSLPLVELCAVRVELRRLFGENIVARTPRRQGGRPVGHGVRGTRRARCRVESRAPAVRECASDAVSRLVRESVR